VGKNEPDAFGLDTKFLEECFQLPVDDDHQSTTTAFKAVACSNGL